MKRLTAILLLVAAAMFAGCNNPSSSPTLPSDTVAPDVSMEPSLAPTSSP